MIARTWKGITTKANAEPYLQFLTNELKVSLDELPGYQSIQVLRRAMDEQVEFTTIIIFDTIQSIKLFAGEDYEKAHISAKAAALLYSYNDMVIHYEVVL